MLGDFDRPSATPDELAWSVWAHQIVFLVWGLSLTVATFAYWRATRPKPDPRSARASHRPIKETP